MKRSKLGDLCDLFSGGTPSTKVDEYWNGDIPWISSAESGKDFIYDSTVKITQKGVEESATKKAGKGTILIATAGEGKTRGQVSFLENDIYINQSLINISSNNNNEVDNLWLYYYLKNGYDRLRKLSDVTGVRGSLSGTLLKTFIVDFPDIITQRKIANLLRSIDYKIEINNRINDNLQQLSSDIFSYWFKQFQFPNQEGKPYKSSGGKMVYNKELKREIPEGWTLKHAVDIAEIKTGKEDANHSTENGQFPFFTCSNDILKCDDYKFDSNSILIAGNGDFNVKHYKGKFNAYQRTYVITPFNEKYIGLFELCCNQTIERFKKGSNGSIVKFITLGDIQNIQMLDSGHDDLLKPFNDVLEKIDIIKKENQELASLRDFLLPMLMNGQVTFK